MAKDYDNKRTVAQHMYITERRTAKEIALKLNIAQKTVGEWVKKYGWKELREAKAIAPAKRSENIEKIISGMAEKRIRLETDIIGEEAKPEPDPKRIEELRKEIAALDYAVANWNKSLASVKKENRLTLVQKLQVIEEVFKILMQFDYPLFLKTLDFQEHLVSVLSQPSTPAQ